ncbi:hypothetical protein LNQ49_21375 [Flavobacterium sp. F-65]|jgi:hypothetical protein|uniref:Uncharacterized protein n=1 Tax=Flavobacterium pisciphilum TaxID=2893755 RepID=A0ABS8MZF1_9FLAO|nr:hypothetical protein [Flavobacterium sp. F-65]MCC9074144.1 hypothetical protein [Flavobacterium sp. F-65]
MFLNYIKVFFVKKSLNKNLDNVKNCAFTTDIQTVGLLIDGSDFSEKDALLAELVSRGIVEKNIKVVVYKDKFDKKEAYTCPTFGINHLNWSGEITENLLKDFIKEEFDLLISYYDIEKAMLMLITQNSKAKFKVGFASVDKRLNRVMINTNVREYKVFVNELFKYLKNIKQNII